MKKQVKKPSRFAVAWSALRWIVDSVGVIAILVVIAIATVLLVPTLRERAFGPSVPGQASQEQVSPLVGTQANLAPYPSADGHGTLDLAAYRGHPVFVNFFASWCPPCNMEAPTLAAMARFYGPQGLVVIGIDEGEDASRGLAFAKAYKLPYPIFVDSRGSAGQTFGGSALPTQLFIDRTGRVAAIRLGMLEPPVGKAIIASLLAGGE